MVRDSNLVQAGIDPPANGSKPESLFFDTKIQFEAWLDQLRPGSPLQIDHDSPDFIIECDPGSNCEILFEGVLHLKGFLGGSIRSPGGTLVTGPGIINAKIEVGTAIIGSFGNVNVTASERVLLRGNVIVEGNIRSNSLSIREGTFFDGNCGFLENLTR
ncbi:MAG TPA: polymer-forming cytoskeletal protein, partial [Pyrinomonadaceae bacterium]|nr:polymer-forming cytoskeletal protein [Pyrinomonadaceae bacterium]